MLGKAKKARQELVLQMLLNGRLNNISLTASKLNCSNRTIERIINSLKKEGYQISYNRYLKRYKIITENHNGQRDIGDAENLKE